MKLTGKQRVQLTLLWIQRGKQGDREKFIKRVCEVKGIEYIAPIKVERKEYGRNSSRSSKSEGKSIGA